MTLCGRYRRSWSTASACLFSLIAIADSGVVYHVASDISNPFFPALSRCPSFAINCSHKDLTKETLSLERHRWRRKESQSRACPRSRKPSQFRMSVYGEGDSRSEGGVGGGKWPGSPRKKRPLQFLAEAVNAAVLEMCVQSQGRPLAIPITDLVERIVEAFVCGELIFVSYFCVYVGVQFKSACVDKTVEFWVHSSISTYNAAVHPGQMEYARKTFSQGRLKNESFAYIAASFTRVLAPELSLANLSYTAYSCS